MPRPTKRSKQITALANEKRRKSAQAAGRQVLEELAEEARQMPWCSPASVQILEDDTDSDENDSDFEEGPDLFVADIIYAKKTNREGESFYLVNWVNYDRLTWQPEHDLPYRLIAEFNSEELGVFWPVDYRASIPFGFDAGLNANGTRARR
ncbi:hypothetical protein F443_17822 [Phytophthora nicotianae P1569]|uniref:Chromo domain-containing protein n=1 Tax=Phytophthora nicotianae P1569 TaxID=1317065 RepID=V9EBT1_PHYNI|nr:hypothetical protein F443_17822 [Phytophthora nicotianae P1569]